MHRLTTRARLGAIIAAVLTLPVLVLVGPANAEDPLKATRTGGVTAFNVLDDETQIGLAASVSPAVFTPGNYDMTGTISFRDSTGAVVTPEIVVREENGYAQAYIPKPATPTTYFADFHASGIWADSSSATGTVYKPSTFRTVTITLEPTLLKLTAGSPKLTLTLASYARFNDGSPAPGITTEWVGDCLLQGGRMCSLLLQYCKATSDSTGFASCRGAGTLGSLVSILGGSVGAFGYATSNANAYRIQVPEPNPPVIVRS